MFLLQIAEKLVLPLKLEVGMCIANYMCDGLVLSWAGLPAAGGCSF